jgi:hypothetical protein
VGFGRGGVAALEVVVVEEGFKLIREFGNLLMGGHALIGWVVLELLVLRNMGLGVWVLGAYGHFVGGAAAGWTQDGVMDVEEVILENGRVGTESVGSFSEHIGALRGVGVARRVS